MNLTKLFETQKVLDGRIVKEKGLEGRDLLPEKILALQVELGELANEWRGFKFWSEDREPRTNEAYGLCEACGGTGTPFGIPDETGIDCWKCGGDGALTRNPLLEEYVDCLHFILSIGNHIGVTDVNVVEMGDYTRETTTETFIYLQNDVWDIYVSIKYPAASLRLKSNFELLFTRFVGLGELQLGFTWEQIETAYFEKNQINHERQNTGY